MELLSSQRAQEKSMWRFGSLMALDINDAKDRNSILSLGEGHTPLIPLTKTDIAKQHGDLQNLIVDNNYELPFILETGLLC